MAEKRVIEQTASSEIYNDDWFLKDSVSEGTSKISGVNLKELLGADGTQALEDIANAIAEEYDSTQTYTYNSWVFHEGVLYRCITQSVTGTWDATKWQAKTIKEFIADSENLITSRLRAMFGEYLPISTLDPPYVAPISKGDIFIYQQTNRYKFYRAKADHPQGVTEFDIDDWDEFDTVADLIEDVTENAGKVDDVKVDGTSVVTNKVAEIEIPVKDVQVKTDSTYDSVVDASGNAKIDLSSVTAYGEVPNLPQAIATFKDGADAPMKSLKVAIEPQQDLHGYDALWPAGGGKNKLDKDSVTWNSGVRDDEGVPTASVNTSYTSAVKVLPNTQYTISGNLAVQSYAFRIYFLTSNEDWISRTNTISLNQVPYTFTTPNDCGNIQIQIPDQNKSLSNVQLELGSSATSFAPYSNIYPISGWDECNANVSGVNVWDEEWEVGRIDGNTGQDLSSNDRLRSKGYILVKPNTTYNVVIPQYGIWVYPYKLDKTYKGTRYNRTNGQTFVVPNDCYYLRFEVYADYGTTYNNDISINYPSTATSYEAYNGHTYTIDLDGTRYGGELDVINGVLKSNYKIVNAKNLGWSYFSTTNACYASCSDTDATITPEYPTGKRPIYCNIAKDNETSAIQENQVQWGGATNNKNLNIKNTYTTSLADWQNYIAENDVMIAYAIEPIIIQLTPTQVKSLLGSNNVWADTGDINECVYRRDMSSTIDDIIARLEALEG